MAKKTLEEMRLAIKSVYGGWKWKNRVDGMPANQVVAIYRNFESSGKFNKPKLSFKRLKQEDFHQITMFEYLEEKENERKQESCN